VHDARKNMLRVVVHHGAIVLKAEAQVSHLGRVDVQIERGSRTHQRRTRILHQEGCR
jgi:hypothetical protein